MSVTYWTVVFKEKNDYMPVYEGVKDGRYWLGGPPSLLYPLLFSSKREADAAIERIKIIELGVDRKSIWSSGSFESRRASLDVI